MASKIHTPSAFSRFFQLSALRRRFLPIAANERCQSTGSCYPTDDNESGLVGGQGGSSQTPAPGRVIDGAADRLIAQGTFARSLRDLTRLLGAGSTPLPVALPASA